MGIKLYTEVKSRVDDFTSIGFEVGGITEKTPKTNRYYFLRNTNNIITGNTDVEIKISRDINQAYNAILSKQIERFEMDNNIQDSDGIEILYVALDKDRFVGAVEGVIYEDSMYLSRLVVVEDYRGKGIGANLMRIIEEKAKELDVFSINLGTISFQAPDFYQKLGYKVVFIKENDPRGFKTYSMIKNL